MQNLTNNSQWNEDGYAQNLKTEQKNLVIKSIDGFFETIILNNIQYLEADGHTTKIFTTKSKIVIPLLLADVEAELPKPALASVKRSVTCE